MLNDIGHHVKKRYSTLLSAIQFLILIVGMSVALFLFSSNRNISCNGNDGNTETQSIAITETDVDTDMLDLGLPLRYFTDDNIAWGSAGKYDDKNTWTYAAVGGTDAYQSFPTKTITLSTDLFSTKIEPLPPSRTRDEVFGSEDLDEPWIKVYERQVQEYGKLATRFLFEYEIVWTRKFDVDTDGEQELIIALCGVWGNHCPHKIIIVKNGETIFSVFGGAPTLNLSKTETGDGFYVHWVSTEMNRRGGMCCPLGYVKTRFVYEDGKFKPVYEQKVLYFGVENTETR